MDRVILVANLKSHKTESEAKIWLEELKKLDKSFFFRHEIIVSVPFTLLDFFKRSIHEEKLKISLAAENISEFDEGPYTGEVNAKQIKEFADFVLIGHSERRTNFNESNEVLLKKVQMANKYNLVPIFIIQNPTDLIPQGVELVAYEPISAIGSGNPESSEKAEEIALEIKQKGNYSVLYGGSVNAGNVKEFTVKENIDGVLVGSASLDAQEFIKIIQNA